VQRVLPAPCLVLMLAACASTGSASLPVQPSSGAASVAASPSAIQPTPGPNGGSSYCPNPEGGELNTCLGWLKAGTFHTSTFKLPLTYTVPAGWGNLEDLAGNFLLLPVDGTLIGVNNSTSDYLGVYTSVAAAGHCDGKPSTTVSQTWQGLVDWLTSDPALSVTNLKRVTVSGLEGDVMDIAMKDPKGDGCPDPQVFADVYVGINDSSLVHSAGPNYPLRIYLLKHGADTVAIEIADAPGGYYGDWPMTADKVVASFQFTP
jgi:hypothetical protein